MKKLATVFGAVVVSAASGAALAQEGVFEEWDADDSGALSQEEFAAGIGEAGSFGEWDANQDKLLSEDEFALGVFDWVDEDDDDEVAPEEFGVFNDVIGWGE